MITMITGVSPEYTTEQPLCTESDTVTAPAVRSARPAPPSEAATAVTPLYRMSGNLSKEVRPEAQKSVPGDS